MKRKRKFVKWLSAGPQVFTYQQLSLMYPPHPPQKYSPNLNTTI